MPFQSLSDGGVQFIVKLLSETLLDDMFKGEAPGAKVHNVTRVNLYLEVI